MERAVAVKKLLKMLGKKLGYRIDNEAPTPEERATAQAALKAAREERNVLKEKKEARYRAILAADAEYQSLKAATEAAIERVNRLSSVPRRYKITVGLMSDLFFHVKAEGDSWEEVIAKLEKEKQTA